MRKVLIDTDPGVDDAVALALAFCLPDLEVAGLTSVGGNASIDDTTRNLAALLTALGQEHVPFARGAAEQYNGAPFEHAYHIHGVGGLGIPSPAPLLAPVEMPANDFILKAANDHREELTIIALGPLTNLAFALSQDRHVLEGVAEIVVMGAALQVPGNVRPEAEFNVFNDPLAASLIFDSGISVRLVTLDVTRQVFLTREDIEGLRGRCSAADLVAQVVGAWFLGRPDRERFTLHDPLAVAAAAKPGLLDWGQAIAKVQTTDPDMLGKTRLGVGAGSMLVPTEVDAMGAVDFVLNALIGC